MLKMKEKIRKIIQDIREKTRVFFPFVRKKASALRDGTVSLFRKMRNSFPAVEHSATSFFIKWWHLGIGGIFAVLVLYYPVGALIVHHIDVKLDFAARRVFFPTLPNTLSMLIRREISEHMFTPNKPFFYPTAFLDDMPAFQTGVITGVKNIAGILSMVNAQSEKLTEAADRLSYSPFVWHVQNWKPAVSSVKKYKKAKNLLAEYQKSIEQGEETFNVSEEALSSIVEQIAQGLEECVEVLDARIRIGSRKTLDFQADDAFYVVKGQVYVYFLTLRDARRDFSKVFGNEKMEREWYKALESLENALILNPFAIVNASPASQVAPNHLLNMGYYLSRAILALKNFDQILLRLNDE